MFVFSINNYNLLIYKEVSRIEGAQTSNSGKKVDVRKHCCFNLNNKKLD